MNQTEQRDNAKALEAWNEWKEACEVPKCSAKSQNTLIRRINNAFRNKLYSICPVDAKKILEGCKNWALVFDNGVSRPAPNGKNMKMLEALVPPEELAPIRKVYKDYVWTLVKYSSSPELQVIEGQLIGHRSIINGITEQYLRHNHNTIWFNYKENRSRGRKKDNPDSPDKGASEDDLDKSIRSKHPMKMVSLDERIDSDDGKRLQDTIEDRHAQQYQDVPKDIIREYEEKLNDFTWEELAIVLAKAVKMETTKTTQDFVGWGHDKISKVWNNRTLPKCKQDYYFNVMRSKITISLIKNRLKKEKNSTAFLYEFEERFRRKLENC